MKTFMVPCFVVCADNSDTAIEHVAHMQASKTTPYFLY